MLLLRDQVEFNLILPLYTAKACNKFVSPVLAFFWTLDPDENQRVLKLFENEGHSRASTFMALCNRVFC